MELKLYCDSEKFSQFKRKEKKDLDLSYIKKDLEQEMKENSLRTIIAITVNDDDLEKYRVDYHKRYLTLNRT
ncbi:MAG: hypothetical protein ACOCQ1_00520 [Halanaerobiaceae bacterium]